MIKIRCEKTQTASKTNTNPSVIKPNITSVYGDNKLLGFIEEYENNPMLNCFMPIKNGQLFIGQFMIASFKEAKDAYKAAVNFIVSSHEVRKTA